MARRRRHRKRYARRARERFSQPLSLVAPAATGAAGALVVNGLVNYLPLPDALKAGRMIYLTRFGLAVLLGMFGRRLPVLGPYSAELARGAMIVTLADLGKEVALEQGWNLSGTGYIGPARVVQLPKGTAGVGQTGMYVRGMGAYVR